MNLVAIADDLARSFKRLPHADAEEAVSEAAVEVFELAAREPLERPAEALIRQRARWRLLTRAERAREASLDALSAPEDDQAPVELAVVEDDLESHMRLAEMARNPILRRKLAVIQGGGAILTGWNRDLVVLAMLVFKEEEGRRPNLKDVRKDPRLPAQSTVTRLFGSWTAATEAAGMKVTKGGRPREWTNERIAAAIRAFERRFGRLPRSRDYVLKNGLPSPSKLHAYFGTERAAAILAMVEGRDNPARLGALAQRSERRTHNPTYPGSTPGRPIILPA